MNNGNGPPFNSAAATNSNNLITKEKRMKNFLLTLLALSLWVCPAQAAQRNACYVTSRERGQYVVQTAGKAGTIDVYVDGNYVTTVSRINQLWYATKSQTAVVRGYDQNGIVC